MEENKHYESLAKSFELLMLSSPIAFENLRKKVQNDKNTERVEIEEIPAANGTRNIKVSCRSKVWETKLSDQVSRPGKPELRWYLEDFARLHPFNMHKAESIADDLAKYGQNLFELLSLHELKGAFKEESKVILINIHRESLEAGLDDVLWESLEDPSLWSTQGIQAQVVVRRAFRGPVQVRVRARRTFNILYVVARPGMSTDGYIDHRLLSKTVVKTVEAIKADSPGVNLMIVRPGTWEAFVDLLDRVRRTSREYGFFDLVHLDMHGQTVHDDKGARYELAFLDRDSGESKFIDARRIARLLKRHDIPAVLLNTCESASTTSHGDSNLAKMLVQNGVAFVTAMSFKLSVSAAEIFIDAFYKTLLSGPPNYNAAVSAGRNALRLQPSRMARFGLAIPVQDWAVPVLYIDTANTVIMASRSAATGLMIYTQEGALLSPPVRAPEYYLDHNRPKSPDPAHVNAASGQVDPGFIGRDFEILWIETLLCRKANNVLRIHGPPTVGKTYLVYQLGAWWSRTYFASHVLFATCRDPGYVTKLEELLLDRWEMDNQGRMVSSPDGTISRQGGGIDKALNLSRILVIDDLDYLDEAIAGPERSKFTRTCEVLPQLLDSRTRLIFISRKPTLDVEKSQPNSALSEILRGADQFELPAMSPPDAATLGSKLLLSKGEVIPQERSQIEHLQSIYEALDHNPGAIEMVMAHCSFAQESTNPKRILEKIRRDISLNLQPPPRARTELLHILADGGVNFQISMLFLALFSHQIPEDASVDLLDYMEWPVRYEGFRGEFDPATDSIDTLISYINQGGMPAAFADATTGDAEAEARVHQLSLSYRVTQVIRSFMPTGYIVRQKKEGMSWLWIHPMLTAIIQHFLRDLQPQLQVRIERSFVQFMLKKRFTPESLSAELAVISEYVSPKVKTLRDYALVRIQREPQNFVRAAVLGYEFIDKRESDGVIIALADYLRALSYIIEALGDTTYGEWMELLIPLAERIVDGYFLNAKQKQLTCDYGESELLPLFLILRLLFDREVRTRSVARITDAVKYLEQTVTIGERYKMNPNTLYYLGAAEDLLKGLRGEPAPCGRGDTQVQYDSESVISVADLVTTSKYGQLGDESVVKHFKDYVQAARAVFERGRHLSIEEWERNLLETIDTNGRDGDIAEVALAYGRYHGHRNSLEFSESCYMIEKAIVRQNYSEASNLALDGLEHAIDKGNKYSEFDFRRYLFEISELAPEKDHAPETEELTALAKVLGHEAADWCECGREVVRAERALVSRDHMTARKHYLQALRIACLSCAEYKHLVRVSRVLKAAKVIAPGTLTFLELNMVPTSSEVRSYNHSDFYSLLRYFLDPETLDDMFTGGLIFQYDSGVLRDIMIMSDVTGEACVEIFIRSYLELLDALNKLERGEVNEEEAERLAQEKQGRLFGLPAMAGSEPAHDTDPVFVITPETFLEWWDELMADLESHVDGVRRREPKHDSVRYGILAETDQLVRVTIRSDRSDDEQEGA